MKKKPLPPQTPRQKAYVDAKMENRAVSTILGSVRDLERSEIAQAHLAEARQQMVEITQIKRTDVIEGILQAINRAKMIDEPNTEIAGWREIGKILGHYAPEVKKLVLTDDEDKVVRKLESLSTQELLEMVRMKRAITINGESKVVQ